jgi:hypothetical protein
MEEAAVVEKGKQIFSFIFHKILKEWKKKSKYFLSFSTKFWKNGRKEKEKIHKCWQNSRKIGRMEEVVEAENNFQI